MENCLTLPEGYAELFRVDLQKNKKIAILLNGGALLIAFAMIVFAPRNVPISALFDVGDNFSRYMFRLAAFLVGMILYLVLHEAVHLVFMKRFCSANVRYGFTGLYAYAGSEGYFNKKSYLTIALAPVVIWGIVLGIWSALCSPEWFWVIYFWQIANISGAVGDAYVTCKFLGMPPDILVHDSGVSMIVYSRTV